MAMLPWMESTLAMDPDEVKRQKNRRLGIAYARYSGIGAAVFLLAWLPFNAIRWDGQAPGGLLFVETVVFSLTALLLLLPWKRLEASRFWKPLLFFFFAVVGAFVFTMVIDLIFQYIQAAGPLTESDGGQGIYNITKDSPPKAKPPPPVFQSLMIFIILMQPVVIIFQRKPELLD